MAKTFEQSIAELEEIVEQLENGDVTLDESKMPTPTPVTLYPQASYPLLLQPLHA